MGDWRKMAKEDGAGAPTIWLVRHGKTKLNSDGRSPDLIRGWTDVPLDETGRKEAEEVGKFFDDVEIDAIFTSDLQRCRAVAESISEETGVPITESSIDFRPWNLGDFQGKPSDEVAKAVRDRYLEESDVPVPGGESFDNFAYRYLSTLRTLMGELLGGKWGTVVVVAHYRNLKLAEAWIAAGARNHISKSTFLADDVGTAAVVRIAYEGGKWGWEKVDTGVEGGENAGQKS